MLTPNALHSPKPATSTLLPRSSTPANSPPPMDLESGSLADATGQDPSQVSNGFGRSFRSLSSEAASSTTAATSGILTTMATTNAHHSLVAAAKSAATSSTASSSSAAATSSQAIKKSQQPPSSEIYEPDQDPKAFMNQININGVDEQFLVSASCANIHSYWSIMVRYSVRVGISLVPLCDGDSDQYPLNIGSWVVSAPETIDDQIITRRRFQLKHQTTGEIRSFEHFAIESIDSDLPRAAAFDRLMRSYLEFVEPLQKPLVHLHCLKGRSRSGTLLLTRALLSQPDQSSAEQMLALLRKQRGELVARPEQYEFAVARAQALSGKSFLPGNFSPPQSRNSSGRLSSNRSPSTTPIAANPSSNPPLNEIAEMADRGVLSSSSASDPVPVLIMVEPDKPKRTPYEEQTLRQLGEDGMVLEFLDGAGRDNPLFVIAAITQNPSALQFASHRMRDYELVVREALTRRGETLELASERLKKKEAIVLMAVTQSGAALEFASDSWRNDRDIALAAILQDPRSLKFVGETLKRDLDLTLEAVKRNGMALEFAPHFQSDSNVVWQAIQNEAAAIQFASPQLLADKQFMSRVASSNRAALQYVDPQFTRDLDR